MSAFDVKMQKYIATGGVILVAFFIIFLIAKKFLAKTRDRMFAVFESAFADIYNGPSGSTKQKLFTPLHKIVSSDIKLKNNGLIRILEIGCGNGANLKYFPKNSHLVLVDKNAAFEPLLQDNLKRYPSLKLERLVHCFAEDMKDIESNSVDAVVATLVLCSVNEMPKVLKEILRVLAPGGKFFYLEHVLAKPGTRLSMVQKALSVSRIWPTLFGGCCLDRETGKEVKRAGFSEVDQEGLELYSNSHMAFKFIKSHVVGVATK